MSDHPKLTISKEQLLCQLNQMEGAPPFEALSIFRGAESLLKDSGNDWAWALSCRRAPPPFLDVVKDSDVYKTRQLGLSPRCLRTDAVFKHLLAIKSRRKFAEKYLGYYILNDGLTDYEYQKVTQTLSMYCPGVVLPPHGAK